MYEKGFYWFYQNNFTIRFKFDKYKNFKVFDAIFYTKNYFTAIKKLLRNIDINTLNSENVYKCMKIIWYKFLIKLFKIILQYELNLIYSTVVVVK